MMSRACVKKVLSLSVMCVMFQSMMLIETTLFDLLFCYCSVDDGFPIVSFHFDKSLTLTVYPHEYLFQLRVSKINFRIYRI